MKSILKNAKGQGVIEYLLIVALVGVAAMAVLELVQHSTNYKFAQIANALQGKAQNNGLSNVNTVKAYHYKKKDMGSFMKGAKTTAPTGQKSASDGHEK